MTEHSNLGASAAHRWTICLGSPRMIAAAPPSPPSPYALEGTAAHAVLAWCLTGGEPFMLEAQRNPRAIRSADETIERPIDSFIGDPVELEQIKTIAGVTHVTEEMAQGVQVHIDYVLSRLTRQTLLFVEHRISLAPLDPPAPMFGTTDTGLYEVDTLELETIDFKYGRGKRVIASGNPQTRYYNLGLMLELYARGHKIRNTRSTIIQPRVSSDPSTETMDPVELYDWHTELMDAARRTQDPNAPLVAGDHCDFCAAAPTCPAFRAAALDVARADFSALPNIVVPEPSQLAVPDLLRILDGADLLEQWIGSVRSFAKYELERGVALPGWKLAERVGHRKWKAPESEGHETALVFWETLKGFGLKTEQLYDEPSLKSPAQMEKLLKKPQRESDAFKALWHKPVTGTTMARQNSAAQEVQPASKNDFAPIEPIAEYDLLG